MDFEECSDCLANSESKIQILDRAEAPGSASDVLDYQFRINVPLMARVG